MINRKMLPSVLTTGYKLFTNDEVDYLKDNIYARGDRYEDRNINGDLDSYYFTWRFYNKDFKDIREIIEPRIRTVIDQDLIFDYSHILHSLQPYQLHTDYSQNDMIINDRIKPAYTIIIPLGNFDSNTFVFNQHDEDKNLKNLDRSTVLKDCVDSKTREDHLSHVNQKELDYVSIKEKFTWTKGSLHACDRRYIHCSDNYYKNKGQLYKNAIVFWTSIRI